MNWQINSKLSVVFSIFLTCFEQTILSWSNYPVLTSATKKNKNQKFGFHCLFTLNYHCHTVNTAPANNIKLTHRCVRWFLLSDLLCKCKPKDWKWFHTNTSSVLQVNRNLEKDEIMLIIRKYGIWNMKFGILETKTQVISLF